MQANYVPVAPLQALLARLAPLEPALLTRWRDAYRHAFGATGSLEGPDLERHLRDELSHILAGDMPAKANGVSQAEIVIMMNLLGEAVVAELAARGEPAEGQLAAHLLFGRFCDSRILRVIEHKTRELAESRERNELNLMRAEKLAGLGQLAGGVAHELNNPLATIAITVEDLQDALRMEAKGVPQTWPEVTPALARIHSCVMRCTAIIGAMLDLVRHRPPSNEEFQVNELVTKVAEVTAFPARNARRHVELELAPELTAARSDPGQLQQVLMALVSNAVDATEAGGEVRIRTQACAPYFAIEVHDTGRGIPPDQVGRVFEPFFTTKPPGKGTGLGLSVAYSLVNRLKGKLTLESEPGFGTRVRVLLPLVDEDVG